jgi:hypothetical protein
MEINVSHGCEESGGNSQRVTVGLGSVLSTSRAIPDSLGTVTLSNEVVVQLRPYTLEAQSRLLRVQFNTMRQLQGAEANENSTIEQKADIANRGYDQLVVLSQDILAQSIISVTLPDGTEVTNFAHIHEWVKNLDRASNERLDEEIKGFGKFGITRTLEVTCDHCKNKFTTDMLFDPTSFFNVGS